VASAPTEARAQATWVFEGWVLSGQVGEAGGGLSGVAVSVHASDDASRLGKAVDTVTTNEKGVFRLSAPRGHTAYTVIAKALPGYTSAGAEAAGGNVVGPGRVAFRAPARQVDLGSIKFWQSLPWASAPSSTRPYFTGETNAEIIAVRRTGLQKETGTAQALDLAPSDVHKVALEGETITRMETRTPTESHPWPSGALAIPERYLTRVTEGGAPPETTASGDAPVMAAAGSSEATPVQPVFWASDKMRYDAEAEQFRGALLILLDDPSQEARTRELTAPVEVSITGAESVAPQRVLLDHTNLPPDTVRLAESSPLDSVRLSIRTAVNTRGYDAYVPVMPALTIGPKERSIQGWGMQSVELRIGVKGASRTVPVNVSVETSLGSLDPSTVPVSADRPAAVALRSEGLGRAVVVASAPGFTEARGEYHYDFPLRFFAFALVGGLVGALVTYMRRRQRKEEPDLRVHLVGGILWGVVVSLAYGVLGLSLLEFAVPGGQPFSEGLVFVVSALGALCWIPSPKAAADAGT
jgi:hypothetical protein